MATRYTFSIKASVWEVREPSSNEKVSSPRQVAKSLRDVGRMAQEAFFVLTFNTDMKLIDRHMVSLGTLGNALVHPREVFRPAIADGAAGIMLAHNHPSGNVTPSREDSDLTARLAECAKLLGFKLHDHIIVGGNDFYSFNEHGMI